MTISKQELIKEFDEKFDHYNPIHDKGERIPVWSGADFDNIKNFILSTLDKHESHLKKEWGEERQKAIEELFEIESAKQKDVAHCSCLAYALVKLSGGNSPAGQEMEKRLLELTHLNKE